MRSFEKNLRGLFYECDEKTATFYILAEEISPDTYKFLHTYFPGQNRSITANKFKVKISSNTKAHLDKAEQSPVYYMDLIEQMVEIKVLVKHYSFSSNGKKITGWNMQLIEMHPF
jgi:hypothetical protein